MTKLCGGRDQDQVHKNVIRQLQQQCPQSRNKIKHFHNVLSYVPFTLYGIETSLDEMVLVSTFSNLTNWSTIWLRKLLAFFSLGTTPLMVSGIECFMIIRLMRLERSHFSKLSFCSIILSLVRARGHSVRIAQSRSIHLTKIIICSFHFPKLVPLSTRMLFLSAYIRYNRSINCMQNKIISSQYTTMSFTLSM